MTINKLNGTECGTEIGLKINEIIDEKASVSLDNLDTDGQAILDGKVNSSDLFDANEHIKINKLQSYSFPSSKRIELSIPQSNSNYTAPANGWMRINATSTSTDAYIGIGGRIQSENHISTAGNYVSLFIPIIKDEQIWVNYRDITIRGFFFYYTFGSVPQT